MKKNLLTLSLSLVAFLLLFHSNVLSSDQHLPISAEVNGQAAEAKPASLAPTYKGHFYYFRSFPKTADGQCPAEAYDFYNRQKALPLAIKVLDYFDCYLPAYSWENIEIGNYVDNQENGFCVSEVQGKILSCKNNPQEFANGKQWIYEMNVTKECLGIKCNFSWLPEGGVGGNVIGNIGKIVFPDFHAVTPNALEINTNPIPIEQPAGK